MKINWARHPPWGQHPRVWMSEFPVPDIGSRLDYELEVKTDRLQAKRDHMLRIVTMRFVLQQFRIQQEVSWF